MAKDKPTLVLHATEPNSLPGDKIYAFMSIDGAGNHGIIAASINKSMYPLVTLDAKLLPRLKLQAIEAKRHTNKRIKLYEFSVRREVYEL